MNHTALRNAILLASPTPALQSSVNTDTRLLLSGINTINKLVKTSRVGHKDGPTQLDVENVFKTIFPEQEQMDALVHFVFDCRYGWSERTSDATGHALDPPPSSLHSPARSGGAAARKRVMMGSVSAHSKKKTLNDAADAMIDVLFELPPECRILLALQNCTLITTKPVVRQQVLVHYYSWLKHYLRTKSIFNTRQYETAMQKDMVSLNVSSASSSSAATTNNSSTPRIDELSPEEYACAVRLIILSLTDVWSAIRKASSAHLYSIVDLFPMDQVRKLFEELCDICNGKHSFSDPTPPTTTSTTSTTSTTTTTSSTTPPSSTTQASTTTSSPKAEVASPWQGKNGALMGITVIIKKFRRQSTKTSSYRKHPSPTTAWLTAVEDSSPETGKTMNAQPQSPKSPHSNKLSLNLSSIDGHDQSPPASPAGRAQRFTDWNTAPSPHISSTSFTPSTPSTSAIVSTTSTPTTSTTTNYSKSSTLNINTNSNQMQPQKQPQHDMSISPLGLHHGGSTLSFGMHYQCDGLPEFICCSIHDVTFTLIGHEQLSVRENATRAFAAFLSRCPPNQTINAFSNVIDRLHSNFESSLRSERGSYLAEGLLGLCVILGKAFENCVLL